MHFARHAPSSPLSQEGCKCFIMHQLPMAWSIDAHTRQGSLINQHIAHQELPALRIPLIPILLQLLLLNMASERFNFNVSFSEPVNRPGDEPVLTGEDVWQGIAHGARHPDDMAEYVASCEILSGDKTRFRRKLIIGGGGAVHTGAGQAIEQDVILRHMLNVSLVLTVL